MKILFTGASSFTGFWFVQQLLAEGHSVHALCRKNLGNYEGVRRQRIEQLLGQVEMSFGCNFGSKSFLMRIKDVCFDLFCHHAADVHYYKNPDFDCLAALNSNAKNLRLVLQSLREGGCKRLVLTGSIFEPGEGGDPNSRSFSSYGLSKSLTAQLFAAYTESCGITMGRFVIPNPFGPYEEFRFTSYLAHNWLTGKTPTVTTPAYIRDNIPVDLLAKEYVRFALSQEEVCRPSGYVETQGEFAARMAKELEERFCLPCPFICKKQTEFLEPLRRVNSERVAVLWEEELFWDRLAEYYVQAWKRSL